MIVRVAEIIELALRHKENARGRKEFDIGSHLRKTAGPLKPR